MNLCAEMDKQILIYMGIEQKWKKKSNVGGSTQVYFETWYKCSEITSVDSRKGIWLMGQI